MIKVGGVEPSAIMVGDSAVSAVYHGRELVWSETYRMMNSIRQNNWAYIKTSYTPQIGDTIECEFIRRERNGYDTVFSAGTGTYQTLLLLAPETTYDGYIRNASASPAASINRIIPVSETPYTIRIDRDGALLNGREFAVPQTGTPNTSIRLLRRTDDSYASSSSICRFTAWRNDIKILNLLPAVRTADNVHGMHDTVTNVFYTNASSGGNLICE